MHKVVKVLNNNTILATKDDEEIIIMYKGIGFSKKPGFLFEVPANAKKYLMQKNYKSKMNANHVIDCYEMTFVKYKFTFFNQGHWTGNFLI